MSTSGLAGEDTDSDSSLAAAIAACASEPIRVPGSLQPHGVLVVVEALTGRVLATSEGADAAFDAGLVCGARVQDVPALAAIVTEALDRPDGRLDPVTVVAAGSRWDAMAHRSGDLLICELESSDGDEGEGASGSWHTPLPPAIRRLQDARSVLALCEALADGVAELSGFDRVMVYRFDAAWNGEVLAEVRRDELPSFYGLHFPASDIPAQARALYTEQWLRLIPSSSYTPVPLVPGADPRTGEPFDLSFAALRSVSPVHLKYLENMGVRASMSISLVQSGRLWGLIACHHYAGPHRPSQPVRSAAEFLGRTASLLLPTVSSQDVYAEVAAAQRVRARLAEVISDNLADPLRALTRQDSPLLDLVPCGGVVMRLEGRLRCIGRTPPPRESAMMLDAALAAADSSGEEVFVSSCLGEELPAGGLAAGIVDAASGILAISLDPMGGGLAWVRPELPREVTWGGDPSAAKTVVADAHGVRLTPRNSFTAWREEVRGASSPWRDHEVEVASEFGDHLRTTLLQQVERTSRLAVALQRTLLLEQLPNLPGLGLAARWVPYRDDVAGGDWYDVLPLPSGRTAVVVGDVAGHGLGVSAISAQVRNAMRAYLLSSESGAAALERLNSLIDTLLPGEMATAAVLVLDTGDGTVRLACAGHPPLVQVRAGFARFVHGTPGPALGLIADATYVDAVMPWESGDMLLLYSDGLVEWREAAPGAREQALLAVAAPSVAPGHPGRPVDLDALCDEILAAFPERADDTTLVAVAHRNGHRNPDLEDELPRW